MADATPNSEVKPKKDTGKLFTMAFAGANLVGLGVGAFLVFSSTVGHSPKVERNDEILRQIATFEEGLRKEPVVMAMPEINTNLAGMPRRLVRVEMSLEMLDEEGFEEVVRLGPGARDAIVRLLNAKAFDELESVQGKLHFKNQIITAVNAYLSKGVVKNVYFSDFVVQ